MKHIDVEKLREEIEFAKSVYSNSQRVVHGIADAFRQDGRAAMCDDILKKLDALQQEQPAADLDKEIHEKSMELHTAPCYEELANFARHFYELGLNARKEEGK